MRKFLLSTLLVCIGISFVPAQPQVRPEDHFWRKRVVNRISLIEKVNRPLVYHESAFYDGDGQYTETEGIVKSLVNGLKQGKYFAYHPEDWKKTMDYNAVTSRMREFDQALLVDGEDWGDEDVSDNFTTPDQSEWGEEWVYEESSQEWGSPFEKDPQTDPVVSEQVPLDFAPYEEVIHMVEDWIFDKNTAAMVYQIDFFEVIWVDPTGTLPEKVLARFMWKDVKGQLNQTKWKSRFNDATSLSIAKAFELRIFNGIMINVSGNPIISLQEAARRRQELVEFEHHLWSY